MMTSTELLQEVKRVTEANLQVLRDRFNGLSVTQLSWRPAETSWSIQEIMAHLNQFTAYYHEAFRKYIAKTRFRTPKENFLSSPMGRSAWKSMKLGNARNVKRKFKAQRSNNPRLEPALLSGNDLRAFESSLQDLLQIADQAASVNIRKVKIPIAFSKIVRLRLGDALLFVSYHNERHVQQAINVMSNPKFPQSKS